jgi:23S rRNA-/tRNA-specific pseudouridylate synthase
MARTYELVVGPNEEGLRLDQYLVHRLPSVLSRSVIQRLVRHGAVTVGGRAAKPHRLLRRGEHVHARVEALRDPSDTPPLAWWCTNRRAS